MKLYFAFGSNMDADQLVKRAGPAVPFGIGCADGWRFLINSRGVATLIQRSGSTAWGILWNFSDEQFSKLDVFEGVYYARGTLTVRCGSQSYGAVAYFAADSIPGTPRENYLEGILEAASRWNLPSHYMEELCTWTRRLGSS